MKNKSGVSPSSPTSPALRAGVRLAAVVFCLLSLPPGARADEWKDGECQSEANFVEPILTEETMPNEPRELSLRLTTDFRKRGS